MPLRIQKLASRLTFRQLQVFKAVNDLKSYSKAGDLVGLTQPAVSSQVRHLEQALGMPMFEYVGRKLYCTAAGEEMAGCVRFVFLELERVQNSLAALEGLVAGELRLVPVVPSGHPLLKQQNVTAQEFLDSGLLVRESGSGSRLALELHCQGQRLRAKPSMELGSNDAVKHAVLAGLGVAVLPKLGVLSELALGSLHIVDIKGFPLRRSWCVVYPQARHPTPAMRAFIDYVQQNIRQFEQMFLSR